MIVIPVPRRHRGGMTCDNLTKEQAKRMEAVVGGYLRYLGLLRKRIDLRRFPLDDPLRRDVEEAWNATHGLRMTLHYLSCSAGVGRPAKPSAATLE